MPEPERGRVAKRAAITNAARAVFARYGYGGARIESVAAEAGVSTRTIYNHFDSKEQLFASLIRESSTEVANALVSLIEDYLGDVAEADRLQSALQELAHAWTVLRSQEVEHFALVRRMRADAATMPVGLLSEWSKAGPERVVTTLARRLRAISERGLLSIEDADMAAEHYLALTVGAVDAHGEVGRERVSEEAAARFITAGVRVFLRGYDATQEPTEEDRT